MGRVLLCVTGCIAAPRVLDVVGQLGRAGHSVKTILSPCALQFVTKFSFQARCDGCPRPHGGGLKGEDTKEWMKWLNCPNVFSSDFDPAMPFAHIELAQSCNVCAVLPCTANTLAKLANGLADNLLTSSVLACNRRRMVFPAMNSAMWTNPVTQENVMRARSFGFEVIEPVSGVLACGSVGPGRLPTVDVCAAAIDRNPAGLFGGRTIVVTAGATREYLDPVRYISNDSSGKMGLAIAGELYREGADVKLVCGAVSQPVPEFLQSCCTHARSTQNMLDAVSTLLLEARGDTGLFMVAAPADFRPVEYAAQKLKKDDTGGGHISFQFEPTPDILKSVSQSLGGREGDKPLLVGFALETHNAVVHATRKLVDKQLSYIVLNEFTPGRTASPMGGDHSSVVLLGSTSPLGSIARLGECSGSKQDIAQWLVRTVASLETDPRPHQE